MAGQFPKLSPSGVELCSPAGHMLARRVLRGGKEINGRNRLKEYIRVSYRSLPRSALAP